MTECGFCLSDFEGTSQFFRQVERTCRKPCKCYECHRRIEKGQRYIYSSGMCEGELWSQKDCLDCAEIREAFSCHGQNLGTLWEEMRDYCFDSMNESCFAKLKTVSAKKFLREKWMEWKGLQ